MNELTLNDKKSTTTKNTLFCKFFEILKRNFQKKVDFRNSRRRIT